MSASRKVGTIALLGGDEWRAGTEQLDRELLEASGSREVVVLPSAAAFEHPERAVERATEWFESLGAGVRPLMVLNRRDAEDEANVAVVAKAKLLYLADGSALHLRSVLKGAPLFDAILAAYRRGAVVAASGGSATVVCDPMIDPRGGAYTVGLGLVPGLAVFPWHGTAADHMRQRSIELLPPDAVLAGLDAGTALVRSPDGTWRVVGDGSVTLYRRDAAPETDHDSVISMLKM